MLATDPATATEARSLRLHPERWRLHVGRTSGAGVYRHVVRRSYLDLPTADGRTLHDPRVDELSASLPYEVAVRYEPNPSGAQSTTTRPVATIPPGTTTPSGTTTPPSATMGPCVRTT